MVSPSHYQSPFGLKIDLSGFVEDDIAKILFAENSGVVVQVTDVRMVAAILKKHLRF